MVRLKCPQCATLFSPAGGQSPKCPNCGYTSSAAPSFSHAGLGVAGPPGQSAPSPVPGGGFQEAPSQKTNGLSIAALVLGIVGIPLMMMVIPGLLSLIFGIVGVQQTSKKGQSGKGMAVAGIVLGGIAVGVSAFFWFVVIMEEFF